MENINILQAIIENDLFMLYYIGFSVTSFFLVVIMLCIRERLGKWLLGFCVIFSITFIMSIIYFVGKFIV